MTPRRKSPKQRKVNQQGTLSKSQLISKRKSPRQGKVSKQWTLSKSHVILKRKSPKHENIPQQGAHTTSDVKQTSAQFEEEVESQNTSISNTTEETVDIENTR